MKDLIKEVRNENGWIHENLEELFARMKPMILASYKKYYYGEDSFEDALQNAFVVMMDAVVTFDASRDVTFGKYFKDLLFYNSVGRVKKRIKDSETLVYPSWDIFESTVGDGELPFDIMLVKSEEREFLIHAIRTLDPKEQQFVYDHFVKGKKIKDIAEEMGMHKQSVVKLKRRILDKLKAKLKVKLLH